MDLTIILTGAVVLGTVAALNWRYGVYALFVWIFLQELVRKLTPGQPPSILIISDFVIFVTYISFFLSPDAKRMDWRKIAKWPLVIPLFIFAVTFTALSLTTSSVIGAMLGFRNYFYYLPCMLLGYAMFRNFSDFKAFGRTFIVVSIPLCVLAVGQLIFQDYFYSIDLLNYAVGEPVRTIPHSTESLMFIPSVFGTAWRYSRISLFLFLLAIGIYFYPTNRKIMVLICAACSAFGIFVSGFRTSMYLAIAAIAVLTLAVFYNSRGHGGISKAKTKSFMLLICSGMLLLAILFVVHPDLRLLFFHFSSIYERFAYWLPSDIYRAFDYGGWYGQGVGTLSQGIQYLHTTYRLPFELGVESGIGKLILEMGFPGLISFSSLLFSVIWMTAKCFWTTPTFANRILVGSIGVFVFGNIFEFFFLHQQVLGDSVTLIFQWFFLGAVISKVRCW